MLYMTVLLVNSKAANQGFRTLVLSTEMLGPSKRGWMTALESTTSVGVLIATLIAYLLPDWQRQSWIIVCCYLAHLLLLLVPRSFQNAYGRGDFKQGSVYLRKFANALNTPLAEETILEFEYKNFLHVRQQQKAEALSNSPGLSLFAIKKKIAKRESIFAKGRVWKGTDRSITEGEHEYFFENRCGTKREWDH